MTNGKGHWGQRAWLRPQRIVVLLVLTAACAREPGTLVHGASVWQAPWRGAVGPAVPALGVLVLKDSESRPDPGIC